MCADRRRIGHAHGQALVESVVALAALALLGALVVFVGKLQSLAQAADGVARYLAFECTARIEECEAATVPALLDEARERLLAGADTVVRSMGDASRNRDPSALATPERLWVDVTNRPMLRPWRDARASLSRPSFDAGLAVATGRAGGAIARGADLLSDIAGPGRFGLSIRGGLVEARTALEVTVGEPALRGALAGTVTMRRRAAVLTDAWTASGAYGGDDDTVESRVARGQRLADAMETALDVAYAPTRALIALTGIAGLERRASDFRYHETDVDLVPPDRVGP